MNEKFSKLSLNSEAATESTNPVASAIENNGSSGSLKKPMYSSSGANASSSSQYSNINANLQARVIAFQEQRVLKRSNSEKHVKTQNSSSSSPTESLSRKTSDKRNSEMIMNRTSVLSGSNVTNVTTETTTIESQNIQQIINKPLPPLPPLNPPSSPEKSIASDVSKQVGDNLATMEKNTAKNIPSGKKPKLKLPTGSDLNPNRTAPRRPPSIIRPVPGSPTTASPSITPNFNRKPSLMARRGLQLPGGGMSLKQLAKTPPENPKHQEFEPVPSNKHLSTKSETAGQRSNPGSLLNAVPRTSTSSSTDDRTDTAGTNPELENSVNKNIAINSTGSNSGGSSGSGGLFANFSKYVDIKSGSLNFAGKLSLTSKGINFNNGSSSNITLDELEYLGELGHGNYGNVSKVLYKPTNVIMAMKEVRLELDETKFRHILMELDVLHKCNSPYIVDFFGAFFIEGAVYMCIEYMDGGSLDKIYDYSSDEKGIDEPQLAYITESVIRGLHELKEVHNIIHRDVKPTNILCSASQGTIKLCDFGVSGNLVASLAKTNIGCQSYMAPERIRSLNPDKSTYSVQSDVWSLGLSILELALGDYPYPPETFDNIFSQLSAIVDGPPPKLPERFSPEAQEFVTLCLQKNPDRRPTYTQLLMHPWLLKYRDVDVNMKEYITERLEKRKETLVDTEVRKPALHMGGL
ncbi:hypothetical protein TPHA_0B01150 [Tetrapisispora phaffii CBS 4417]|uniref:mitogen-activated protein kinase kinase n=1 Tax=Tetrapisispora phaffii (strain ATCC 24235 / CBS 4417 / NBRC 1672 / NRRL Y-8282 / UCD 70-5) TaxID=1071381 RepID=G8BP56_TETPH|nr:hypothetical protein TPHA_0B01150 [Tetrapisispora phaffii CBS 4417]CCE61787.1 hypothetical protein TPHA_0B01150 [Tetrapisispora phaffii CBS 4417]